MIRINRDSVEVPEVLQGAQPRYDRPEVREALSQMQHGKCCYCEKKIPTAGGGQGVEHFRPKGKYPGLKDEWRNLLHACPACNGAKREKFPMQEDGTPLLIDPSDPTIDPEDHIIFDVNDEEVLTFGRAVPKDGSPFGEKTICAIKLDVPQQRYDRKSVLGDLWGAYAAMHQADPATIDSKVSAFQALLGANQPYAAFSRAFAREKKLDEKFNVQIPTGADCE